MRMSALKKKANNLNDPLAIKLYRKQKKNMQSILADKLRKTIQKNMPHGSEKHATCF